MLIAAIVIACVAFLMVVSLGGYVVGSRHRRARTIGREGRGGEERRVEPGPPAGPVPPPAASLPTLAPPTLAPPTPLAPPTLVPPPVVALPEQPAAVAAPPVAPRPGFRDRLGKARSLLAGQLAGVRGRSKLDQAAWDELEEALILADVGVVTVEAILAGLKQRAREDGLNRPEQLVAALRQDMVDRLAGDRELRLAPPGATTVWLFVGVNGAGKTTTIGKVAMRESAQGRPVVMAAGDTFRAAAADQLQLWSERVGAGFVRGNEGGDPGAVVFDAVQHANARGVPLVLADTAGRLHTKVNLMEELKKVRRVADRPPGSVAEVLLVIDATTGQNGLVQARQFTEAVGVTGVVLTKLDGTAKGGITVAIASELGIPIKLVGLGEGAGDLVAFDAQEFVDALLPAG
ncbi:MAG: signal recognition particle-docking protein FtsY [Acidimicrobiales bacterium]